MNKDQNKNTPQKEIEKQPNILIFYADDMGYGDLSANNPDGKIPTPNLDRLATEGMQFTEAHASSGICTPSRYALLTGRYHWRDFHDIANRFEGSKFKPGILTMPEMLRDAGYSTACIGKWHLGWDWDQIRKPDPVGTDPDHYSCFDWEKRIPGGPLDQGFDYYFGEDVINFPPYTWIENDRVAEAPDTMLDVTKWKPVKEGNWECREGPMSSDWDPYEVLPTLKDKAVSYVEDRANQTAPFFLYLSFPCPHAPIVPDDEFDGSSNAGPFGDLVCQMDWICGQVLETLEATGQAENTLVIFTSDNGAEKYAYTRDKKFDHWSSGPFRGLKRDVYEGGHHVPFLLRWPGVVDRGQVSHALVSQIDIMRTLARMLDIELDEKDAIDSVNQLPVLAENAASNRQAHVHNTKAGHYGVRKGDWLLINDSTGYVTPVDPEWERKYGYNSEHPEPVELYNIAEDIGQHNNLAAENEQKVKELQQVLKEIQKRGGNCN